MATGIVDVLAASFKTRDEADPVKKAIEAMGYDPKEVSYVIDAATCSSSFNEPGSHWRQMGLGGVVAGGAVGAVTTAVFGSILLLGPIGVGIGALSGGVIGLLLGAGMQSDQATACEKAVKDGSLVMIVQPHPGDADRIRALLGDHIIAEADDE
jgi:uncharacterized membrane protein